MIKATLLGAAMIAAAPAIAQTATPGQTAPTSPSTVQTTQLPPSTAQTTSPQTTTPADPMTDSSVPSSDPAAPAQTTDQTTAQTTTQTTATSEAQIASVVDSQFATYDKDADGALSTAEFASWMVTLRQASDASFTAESKEAKAWTKTAFAQADTDKSKSVSKTELTGFLAANKG